MDRKKNLGSIKCRICGASYQMMINYLTEPVDVFSEWVDECQHANEPENLEDEDLAHDQQDHMIQQENMSYHDQDLHDQEPHDQDLDQQDHEEDLQQDTDPDIKHEKMDDHISDMQSEH